MQSRTVDYTELMNVVPIREPGTENIEIYKDIESIGYPEWPSGYGERWAKAVIEDDSLDTQEKRAEYARKLLAKYAHPKETSVYELD